MPVNKRFFDDLMKDRRISLRSVAKLMDMSPGPLSRTFSGHRRMQLSEAAQLSNILGIPLAEVIINAGINDASGASRRAAIIGHMTGDGTIACTPEKTRERTMLPEGLPDKARAVQARTADSPLAFMDGWVMFVDENKDPNELLGMYCYVKIEDGPALLATVRRGYNLGTYNLFGYNGFTQQSARIEEAARVLITQH